MECATIMLPTFTTHCVLSFTNNLLHPPTILSDIAGGYLTVICCSIYFKLYSTNLVNMLSTATVFQNNTN